MPLSSYAATYTASTEQELIQAINSANASADASSTINLTGNVTFTDATALPATSKAVTIATGAFTLTGLAGTGTTGNGSGASFPGGTLVVNGSIAGGAAAAANSRGAGGVAITLSSGSLTNNGSITGGAGGNTSYGSAAGRISGSGGSGIVLTNSSFTNAASATVTGGSGGTYDSLFVAGAGVSGGAGPGGAGITMTGGSLDNEGTLIGGNGGFAADVSGHADNIFSYPGGVGASLTGGTYLNNGTIKGGPGATGMNQGATGNGAGGAGVALTNGTLVNNGSIIGADGLAGGGTTAGTGSAGGTGAALVNSTLENHGTISGGAGSATSGAAGFAITATTSHIINDGTITAGKRPNGTLIDAINLTGGGNTLELWSGSVITGNVTATAGDTLALGGATNDSFDVTQLGPAAIYRGFGTYQKTGTSIWTLVNTPTVATPWTLLQGELSVATDAQLGAAGTSSLTFNGGTLQVTGAAFTSTARTIVWGANGGGFDIVDAGTTFTVAQSLTNANGGGALGKSGAGSLVLTGTNTYTGGTTISAGTLQLGAGGITGSIVGDVVDNGALVFDRTDPVTFGGVISGTGTVEQIGGDTTTLTGDSTYTGLTTIANGTLQLGDGNLTGSIQGDVLDNGGLVVDHSNDVTLGGTISGSGTFDQNGGGTTTLTGNNSYTGATGVHLGTLLIDGDQSAATGATTVDAGATLGGTGSLGGTVTIADNATLAPGDNGVGTLTMGSLTQSNASNLNVELGAKNVVGGALNDLVVVKGDLTLAGVVNVATAAGGTFDPGVYRLINYSGNLNNQTLAIGTAPDAASNLFVQTAIDHQVNLVNTGGLNLRFWDGDDDTQHNNASIDGGVGFWRATNDNHNWTQVDGAFNSNWLDNAFAVFQTNAATVTVDNSDGVINLSGAQFAVDGYHLIDGILTTTTADTLIVVGDGTADGANMTATIDSTIAGTGGIDKSGAGTLVLGGNNTYTGGTTVSSGVLQVSDDSNLGAAGTGVSLNGGTLQLAADIDTARAISLLADGGTVDTQAHTVTLEGGISGSGDLTKAGTGTLVLNGADTATGATQIAAGTLVAGADHVLSAASATAIAGGATLDLGGHSQETASLSNSGIVAFSSTAAGTTLTVHGNYNGNNGVLQMASVLGDDTGASDRLIIDGGTASGHTAIQLTNLGGLGALTTGNGIELVSAINGATTTVHTTADAFALAGGHVDAGAFEYHLYAGDATGAGENWYLRSNDTTPPPPPPAGDPGAGAGAGAGAGNGNGNGGGEVVTYRPEVALYSALSNVLRQADLSMLSDLHRRQGDDNSAPDDNGPRAWARVVSQDLQTQQSGTVSPSTDGSLQGVQAGVDVVQSGDFRGGVYGGHLRGTARTDGFVSGVEHSQAGDLDVRSTYAGAYGTYMANNDWYADAVLQYGWNSGFVDSHSGPTTDAGGTSVQGSLELGKDFPLSAHWLVEPQVQVIVDRLSLDNQVISGSSVSMSSGTTVTSRLGVRFKGAYATGQGQIQPYARFNIWHGSAGSDDLMFAGPAGSTGITVQHGYTSGEVAVGTTWAINQRFSVYGEVGNLFSLDSKIGEQVKQTLAGSAGVRVAW